MRQLLAILEQEPIVRAAIDDAFAQLEKERPKYKQELKRIDSELRKVNETLDRYFRAFENGTMPEQACAPRIATLTQQLAGLEARRAELAEPDDQPEPLSDDDLAALTTHARQVVTDGDPAQQKGLLQAIVAEIRVVSRAEIQPYFTLPVVRPPCMSVGPPGFEPGTKGL